jgi:hypothetical protein
MTDSTLTTPAAVAESAPRGPASVAELAQQLPGFIQGARWFWWIAGFTAINAALNLSHSNINFVVGLAFTLLAHAGLPQGAALVVDALFVGLFFLAGLHAQKGRTWAFALGAIVYAVDALIYMKFADWLPVAIHAFALFYIGKAFMNLQAAKKAFGLR